MKRQISILACLLMLLAVVFAVASCTQPEAAHVHTYVEAVTKEATCTDKGEVTLTCACGDKYTNETAAKGHNLVTLDAVEPTCVAAGLTEGQQCADCGLVTIAQVTVAAKGHKLGAAATCTTAQTCEYGCGQVFVEALGHNAPAATCTEPSVCKRCELELAPANGHNAPDATCTEDSVCTVCDEVVAEALGHIGESDCYTGWCIRCYEEMVYGNDNHEYNYPCDIMCNKCYEWINWGAEHKIVHVEAKESTCTVNGNNEYWYCEYCTTCWNSENTNTPPTNIPSETLPLAEHEYMNACDAHCMNCYELTNPEAKHSIIHVEAKAPTCTVYGNIEYWYCEYCGSAWSDAELTRTTNRMSIRVPETGHAYCYECDPVCTNCYELTNPEAEHSIIHVEAVAPTCTEMGNIEYWYCEYCGSAWSDAELTRTTNMMSVKLGALGHTYAVACDPVCLVCFDINTEAAHDIKKVTKKAATCTADGANLDYWYCTYCDSCWVNEDCTLSTNKDNVVIPALGHKGYETDYKCDTCSKVVRPAAGTTLTITQANTLAKAMGNTYTTEKYYITGWVTSVANTTYGNLYITDETGDTFYIYGLYSSNGSTRYDKMSSKPVKADEITVYTVVGCYYGAPQGKNAWLDELVKHTTHDWAEATCTSPKKCVRCEVTEGTTLDHNYVDGECTECGKIEGVDSLYNATLSFSSTANRISYSSTQQVWSANGVTLTNDKASSSSNVGDYTNPIRLYQGSKVTIEGVGMTKVQITRNTGSKATAADIQTYLKSANSGATVTVSGNVITIVFDKPVDSFYFSCGAQVRLDKIVVNP